MICQQPDKTDSRPVVSLLGICIYVPSLSPVNPTPQHIENEPKSIRGHARLIE